MNSLITVKRRLLLEELDVLTLAWVAKGHGIRGRTK